MWYGRKRTLLCLVLPLSTLALLASAYRSHLSALATLLNAYTFPFRASVDIGSPSLRDGLAYPADFVGHHVQRPAGDDLVVPEIFHGVLLGGLEMRPQWREAVEDCKRLHPTAKFMLWTDGNGTEFVRKYYPDLLEAYLGYRQTIQRSNILRYLVLHHYGGIYRDLDLACRASLDPLRRFHMVTPPAAPAGVNNAFIAASPRHPLLSLLVSQINQFNLRWPSPYFENMASTGCLFFSAMHLQLPPSLRRSTTRILPGKQNRLNGHVATPFFEHFGASTWHRSDARFIIALGKAIEACATVPGWAVWLALATLTVGASYTVSLVWRDPRGSQEADLEEGYADKGKRPSLSAPPSRRTTSYPRVSPPAPRRSRSLEEKTVWPPLVLVPADALSFPGDGAVKGLSPPPYASDRATKGDAISSCGALGRQAAGVGNVL